uniref:Sperm associated antigen 17 n=1 Tax=Nothobranchius kadleci TaxID=1051664 RepID=A0A1A8BW97_NOTKA
MEKMTLEPIIRKDSLKAWRLEQEQLKEEEMLKRPKNKNTPRAKQQKEEAMGNKESKDLSGVKKSRVDTTSTFAKAPSSAAPTTSKGNQDPPPTEEPLSVSVSRKVDNACDGGQKISSNRSSDDGQTGCPEKTGGEKGGVSTKEQVVLVEKDGCASVEMCPERHTAHVRLADGTVITGTNRADYKVCCRPVGVLQVQSDGSCLYSSHAPVCCLSNQPGVYMMSHTHSVVCDVTDEDGNHFQVFEDGRISVVPFSPVPIIQTPEEEGQEKAGLRGRHCPRLFLVHEDGSGSELLSRHAVEELLKQSRSDPTIAVLKEPLPHKQGIHGAFDGERTAIRGDESQRASL